MESNLVNNFLFFKKVRVEFGLTKHYSKNSLKEAINKMWYQGSSTRTGDALMALKNQVFTDAGGMRSDKSIPKVNIFWKRNREVFFLFSKKNDLIISNHTIFSSQSKDWYPDDGWAFEWRWCECSTRRQLDQKTRRKYVCHWRYQQVGSILL